MTKIFGTDGIRGVANVYPMTAELALQFGKAAATLFRDTCKKETERHKIIIGKDTRLSGYVFETALTAGILSMGVDVYLVGPMPTPAVAHLTKSMNADAGIVITASHNPAIDNGLKLFSKDGYKLPDEVEEQMEQLMLHEDINNNHIQGELIGKAYRISDAIGRYIEFAKNSIKSMSLHGLKIVIDCANGAGYKVAPIIFSELGAEVIAVHKKPNGLNINLNCGALHPAALAEVVLHKKADIGIALDGDADRVIFVDADGKVVDGDHIMAIAALDLKKRGTLVDDTIVCTVMSNIGLVKAMNEHGITVVNTPVGDRYIIEELQNKGYSFGGEQSGHIVFSDYSTTGDGIITALHIVRIMKEKGEKLSVLAECMNTFPQILLNVEVSEKKDFEKMESVKHVIKKAEEMLADSGRVLVRYSGTENVARVMVEGEHEETIKQIAEQICAVIRKEIGV